MHRGEVRLLGATSADKYRRFIERDPGLERRFQALTVEAPSTAAAVSVLRGLRHKCVCTTTLKRAARVTASCPHPYPHPTPNQPHPTPPKPPQPPPRTHCHTLCVALARLPALPQHLCTHAVCSTAGMRHTTASASQTAPSLQLSSSAIATCLTGGWC